jgi:branched-chain amino acid transport system permease protein
MRAVREDEVAAEAVGINTTQIKVMAFVISSMWAGVAGALQVHLDLLASPDSFKFTQSVLIVVMVVLGGLGSITGAALAAVLLTVLGEVLRSTSGAFWTIMGMVVFAAILSFPRHRAAMRAGFPGWLRWLLWPVICGAGTIWLYTQRHDWLESHVAQLRFIIYAGILIVLMLLRPQGLLGRHELSFAIFRRRPAAPVEPELQGAGQ